MLRIVPAPPAGWEVPFQPLAPQSSSTRQQCEYFTLRCGKNSLRPLGERSTGQAIIFPLNHRLPVPRKQKTVRFHGVSRKSLLQFRIDEAYCVPNRVGRDAMVSTVHYFERQAARERRAAREALTEAARERHAALAAHFATLAERAQQSRVPQAIAVGQK